MEVIIGIVGVLIGFFTAIISIRSWRVGTLHVVKTKHEVNPQLLLELECPIPNVVSKRYAIVRVVSTSTRD